ncbi:MYND finger [Necator americanus]|uniref:MYND finger n=1 Tax=Necator americanus TaxID=51031 RepID=W2TKE4_NECAM|nr:MYND finger [Necator americanus]ETN82560.1 MYND finger [Necator americanus]
MSTLICEEPFSAAVESGLLQNVCHSCFLYSRERKLRFCSRCLTVHYCSVKCQRNDWHDHSAECKCLKKYSPRIPSCFVRLLARFYWKMSAKGQAAVSFNSRRCYDLADNCHELVKSPKHMEYFSSLFNILVEYMYGTEVTSKKEMFSIYGKVI